MGGLLTETIDRRIQFYQVEWIKGDKHIRKELGFLNSILANMSMIETADEAFNIYIENYKNDLLSKRNSDKSFWKLSKIRNTDYPLKFNKIEKTSSSLNLTENEGLQDPAHFVVFNGVFIGAELNINTPRVATVLYREINKYLNKTHIDDISEIEIRPLLRDDAYKKIDKMIKVHNVEIKIATNYAQLLNKNPYPRDYSIGKTFASAEVAQDMTLGLKFFVRHGKNVDSKRSVKQILNDVKSAIINPECFDSVKIAKIKGQMGGSDFPETVDLLEDSLMVTRSVAKLNDITKAVDPLDMYEKILDSHTALKSDLEKYSSPITK